MIDLKYCNEMLERGRLWYFQKTQGMGCIISYYICEKEDLNRIINADPFHPTEDRSKGKICYVAVLLTDKLRRENAKLSYEVWRKFKDYLKVEYPFIKVIYWRRFNQAKNKVDTFIKII